jgi:hypothetical protein
MELLTATAHVGYIGYSTVAGGSPYILLIKVTSSKRTHGIHVLYLLLASRAHPLPRRVVLREFVAFIRRRPSRGRHQPFPDLPPLSLIQSFFSSQLTLRGTPPFVVLPPRPHPHPAPRDADPNIIHHSSGRHAFHRWTVPASDVMIISTAFTARYCQGCNHPWHGCEG